MSNMIPTHHYRSILKLQVTMQKIDCIQNNKQFCFFFDLIILVATSSKDNGFINWEQTIDPCYWIELNNKPITHTTGALLLQLPCEPIATFLLYWSTLSILKDWKYFNHSNCIKRDNNPWALCIVTSILLLGFDRLTSCHCVNVLVNCSFIYLR